jgi:PhnB protein
MAAKVAPIPEGYRSVTPYLIVKGAARAIEFYQRALGAKEVMRFDAPDGRVGHAEIKIGNSIVMLADESPQMGAHAPHSSGRQAVSLYVYVADVDATFKRALDAGAKQLDAVQDKFYGDRMGAFVDPFGHSWYVSTHVEDVSPDELKRRAKAAMEKATA